MCDIGRMYAGDVPYFEIMTAARETDELESGMDTKCIFYDLEYTQNHIINIFKYYKYFIFTRINFLKHRDLYFQCVL